MFEKKVVILQSDSKTSNDMKTNKTFFTAVAVAAVTAGMLCACNPDVQLNSNEDSPKVAEALLGMTSAEATAYLEKQGFCFGNKADYADEYVFSKDASLREFSYEASIMLMFGTFETDTVKYAAAFHRMQTEKSARDLYWKWSHYTATVTLPKVYFWNGSFVVKYLAQSQQPDRWTTYCDGSIAKQMLDDREEDYKNGKITKEEYDSYVTTYTRGREQFWTDYKREGDNIDSAYEEYRNEGDNYKPKEIELSVYMNNGGEIQLYYETRDFVVHWESPADKIMPFKKMIFLK